MADVDELIEDGAKFATQAVAYDQQGDAKSSIFFYKEAAAALLKADSYDPTRDVRSKAMQYIDRVEFLRTQLVTATGGAASAPQLLKSWQQKDLEKADFLVRQGLDEDEKGNKHEALPLYMDAAELCLRTSKDLPDGELKRKLNLLARQALERGEAIKMMQTGNKPVSPRAQHKTPGEGVNSVTSGMGSINLNLTGGGPRGDAPSSSRNSRKGTLTKDEMEVLKITSFINGKKFLPWLDDEHRERFAYSDYFNDPDGKLALSPKQKNKLASWIRPSELCDDPVMIYAISSFSIKQTIVSDCSFVASLAISAAYERQFKKRIITSIIYPQNREGKPVINPSGKYMIKLRLNGIARKVVIDDTLPLGRDGQLLCSFSTNSNEVWISLIEKAYMKVMGGYDFPGSNSSIDLHALTGWIPERMSIKLNSPDFQEALQFNRLMTGLRQGDCLITVATGYMSDDDADRAGLVPTHAYAVLDIRKVEGKRMLQLKNPWSHLRWKGKFSEKDSENWTPELQRALNYDRKSALQFDNGVFWINWESLLNFYDVIYLNWNPKLFKYKYTYHATWKAKEGPKKDVYMIGNNPQYRLEVNAGDRSAVVWILLTRHITLKEDFAENKEFITVHVYKSDGNRVYYPENPFLEGTKINSPFYLAKMNDLKGTSRFTLVVSQYEKTNTINYTLKVFSSSEFRLAPVTNPYIMEKEITAQWTKETAGGCPNYPTYSKNPVYHLELTPASSAEMAEVIIKIRAPKVFSVGAILKSVERGANGRPVFEAFTDTYRPGFYVRQLSKVPGGSYHLIPSTFLPGQEGHFFLSVGASCRLTLAKL